MPLYPLRGIANALATTTICVLAAFGIALLVRPDKPLGSGAAPPLRGTPLGFGADRPPHARSPLGLCRTARSASWDRRERVSGALACAGRGYRRDHLRELVKRVEVAAVNTNTKPTKRASRKNTSASDRWQPSNWALSAADKSEGVFLHGNCGSLRSENVGVFAKASPAPKVTGCRNSADATTAPIAAPVS